MGDKGFRRVPEDRTEGRASSEKNWKRHIPFLTPPRNENGNRKRGEWSAALKMWMGGGGRAGGQAGAPSLIPLTFHTGRAAVLPTHCLSWFNHGQPMVLSSRSSFHFIRRLRAQHIPEADVSITARGDDPGEGEYGGGAAVYPHTTSIFTRRAIRH